MSQKTQNVLVKLTIAGEHIEGAVALPVGRSPRRVILPALQHITDAIVEIAQRQSRASGQDISCKKGCDACCRQMVPIAPTEAFALAALVEAMNPVDAAQVMERFDQAVESLEDGGILDRLRNRHRLSADDLVQLDRDYFSAQVPCPFLVDRACSVHEHRPLSCREFLVTSHPKHCKSPGSGHVKQLPLPAKLSKALWESDLPADWLPLTLAREFIAKHRKQAIGDPAMALNQVLKNL